MSPLKGNFCFLPLFFSAWVMLFLFLCMSCNFLSKIGHFTYCIVATLDTIPFLGLLWFCLLLYLFNDLTGLFQ